MRLSVRKAFNFVNRDEQQSFRKYLDEFTKTSKIGTSMESLIACFFFFIFLPKLSKVLFWVVS